MTKSREEVFIREFNRVLRRKLDVAQMLKANKEAVKKEVK